jgi:hypothetical protein
MNKAVKLATLLSTLTLATPAYAQDLAIPRPPGYQIEDLGLLISRAIGVALLLAGILVFVYLVWGGIQWITSGGDKGKTEEARSRITSALIGLAIVAAAWAIMQLIAFFFGIDILGGGTVIEPGYE